MPDGFAFASGVELRNGTVEADVAAYPDGAFFGVAFHVQSPDQYEVIFFRPGATRESVQYSPSFLNMNAWQLFSGPEYTAAPKFPLNQWVHLRIVVRGLVASFFLDTASSPTIEVHDLAQGSISGTIGFWGRGGGGYLSNVRYRPDTTTYPLAHTHTFARGAITDGWAISDAFPVQQADPDIYPKVGTLRWQPVQAEREGIVLIGRYRKDPRVESPQRLSDEPAKPAPGSEVVFARTTIRSDRDLIRKMWVGYTDDVVVYLNGRPLYAGRNSMFYRDPNALGWFYPYADAVFLPLKKGPNELLLAVTETSAGWAFMCRFDSA